VGALQTQGLHKGGHIIRKELGRIDTRGFIGFARSACIDGDAGEVFGVLGDLKGITGVIGGQVGDKNERLSGSLLIVVHGYVVHFDSGHDISSLRGIVGVVCRLLVWVNKW
jgi:hypothetical protein